MGKILMLLGFLVIGIGVFGDYVVKFITTDGMRLWFYFGGVVLLLAGIMGNNLKNTKI